LKPPLPSNLLYQKKGPVPELDLSKSHWYLLGKSEPAELKESRQEKGQGQGEEGKTRQGRRKQERKQERKGGKVEKKPKKRRSKRRKRRKRDQFGRDEESEETGRHCKKKGCSFLRRV